MPKFKNTSTKPITILHQGKKYNIRSGEIIEGPAHFSAYRGLKELRTAEVEEFRRNVEKVKRYNPTKTKSRSLSTNPKYAMKNGYVNLTINPNNTKKINDTLIDIKSFNVQDRSIINIISSNEDMLDSIVENSHGCTINAGNVSGVINVRLPDSLEVPDYDVIEYILKMISIGGSNLPNEIVVDSVVKEDIINIFKSFRTITDSDITYITIVNNINQYKALLNDLKLQNTSYNIDIIPIYNFNNTFSSASEALNTGIEFSNSSIVNLCHQDLLVPNNWTHKTLEHINKLNVGKVPWGVLGMAGSSGIHNQKDYNVLFIKDHMSGHSFAQTFREQVGSVVEVQCLDELSLIINKDNGVRFDEDLNGWHWYGSDMCLQYLHRGFKNFAIDAECCHLSDGQTNLLNKDHREVYVKHAKILYDKWSHIFTSWKTTTGMFLPNNIFLPLIFSAINHTKSVKEKLPSKIDLTKL